MSNLELPPLGATTEPREGPSLPETLDLRRLLQVVLRRKWAILCLAAVFGIGAALYANSLTPVYRATASIVLEVDDINLVSVEDVYAVGRRGYEYFITQFEILQSQSLAERAAERLRLPQHSMFAGAATTGDDAERPWYKINLKALLPATEQPTPDQPSLQEQDDRKLAAAAAYVAGGLDVEPIEYSYIAYLSFSSPDAGLATRIVNAVAEEFITSNLESRLSGTVEATGWLNERLTTLKANLRASELALQDFRDREGLVQVDGVTGLGSNDLTYLSARLEEARKRRIEAGNLLDEVDGLSQVSTEALLDQPAILNHPLISVLNSGRSESQRRVSELEKRYGPKHPKMIAAQTDLAESEKALEKQVQKVVSGIEREYRLAQEIEAELEGTWSSIKTEVQDFNRKQFELQELERDLEANRQLYDVFFTRLKSVSQTGGFEKPHARILDRATVPSAPVWPNKQMIVMIATLLGLALGCAITVLLDLLDNTIKLPEDVMNKLKVPLLGTLPKMAPSEGGDFEQYWQRPQGEYAESIRTIRTGLLLGNLDSDLSTIVITSTVPGEGKSTTVLNLGAALGQMQKTLVIGADLRRPSIAQKCDLASDHKGLSHFVSGASALEDCIEHLPDLNIHVMPAGIIPPNPLEMISSQKFVEALGDLKQRFDRIVIDSAPIQAVSDALVLASYADAVVYVVQADSTHTSGIRKGIESLRAAKRPLSGVVLNQFDSKKARDYLYGDGAYSYRYGNYYGADEADKA